MALTRNYDNIVKIKETYNKELKINKYLINNKEIINKIEEYDNKLSETDDKEEIKKIIINMINVYKDKDDVKMAKIS